MNPRKRISLDGTWHFQIEPVSWVDSQISIEDIRDIADWRTVHVPAPWQAQFDDLRLSTGTFWYKRTFRISPEPSDTTIILHFGAVNYFSQLWLNGIHLGENEGGYLPFEFEVGQLLQAGDNELALRVTLPDDDRQRFPDFPFSEIPHGKQSWYGPQGGIWQSVWLEHRSSTHLKQIRLNPDLQSGQIEAALTFSQPAGGHRLILNVFDPNNRLVISTEQILSDDTHRLDLTVRVDDPQAWSPDQPDLYRFEGQLWRGEAQIDTLTEIFGFRTIEARDGRLWLNGDPLYLRGALDQDYYPGTISTPPSTEFLEDQIRKAKAMGLNCFRCHIKVPDPRYYEVADRLGMLIWTDLPNWQLFTEQVDQRAQTTLQGMVERDGNHPSIIAWTIINEDWGVDLVNDETHRAWLRATFRRLKELDPTRLIVDNSACIPNFHVETDIEDYHYYRAIPDHRHGWDTFVESFASHPDWTFSPHGDIVRAGDEPLVMSEFGNWGLPDVDLLKNSSGQEPWWFETGENWNDGVMYPHGVKRRFLDWHLDQVFGSWSGLVKATQLQQYYALKYEIEVMRQYASICGYVITELTDAHWEANGLMDMQRNPRLFHTDLAAVNADTVIIPRWHRTAYEAGESVEMALSVAHGAGKPLESMRLEWHLSAAGLAGSSNVPKIEAGQTEPVIDLTFPAPDLSEPATARLELSLLANDGTPVASNHVPLTFLPQRQSNTAARIWSPDAALAEQLVTLGYQCSTEIESADLVITNTLDESLATHVRRGGRLLLLADRPESIEPAYLGIQVAARQHTAWAGDWASSFAWLRRDGPFARFPGGPLLDYSFDGIIPEHVLIGFSPQEFKSHVHAGIFVGWIHKSAALIAERRYGRGQITVSTFQLTPTELDSYPVARALLDSLTELTFR